MSKMDYSRPSFRSPNRAYESNNGSDLPREFWGNPRFKKHTPKAELRRDAEEACRQFKPRKLAARPRLSLEAENKRTRK